MFDIIKDLKRNIQKNNMKKLVLSAVLGLFCYCTNNTATSPQPVPEKEKYKDIKEVLTLILESQIEINKAREEIKDYEKKIYYQISEVGKVTKKKVLGFISERIASEEKTEDVLKNDIEILGQYYHLEDKKEEYECTKDNLTEIFWEGVETIEEEDKAEIETDGEQKIKKYFQTIIDAEKAISKAFQEYYDAKKAKKEEAEYEAILKVKKEEAEYEAILKVKKEEAEYEAILKEIMNDCCGEETEGDIQTKFLNNLEKLCTEKSIDNSNSKITGKIKRRITLSNDTEGYEKVFISFLKQKIGEEKKNDNPGFGKGGNPAKEEGCPCCNDCCGKE